MRAGLYARVSTTEQAEEGYSIDEQVIALERYCRSKGWQVVDRYVDLGISGSTADRPELRRLLADAQAGRFDVVTVHAVDRFYRNLQGLLGALDRLHQVGVGFVSITEAMDFTTSWGKLTLAVLGSLAEIYIDKLSAETSKGKRGRARKGLSNASHAPYGYTRTDDDEFAVDPEQAEVVVAAFESYAGGQYSDITLAKLLNQKGYKPSGRARSGRWTREGVRYLLNNPFYVGLVKHGDDLYDGQHEPIISQDVWDQVQALRVKRGQGKGAGRRPDRVYLLARIARCHDCGLPLVAQTSNHKSKGLSYQYYYCPSYRRSVDCGVGKHFIHGYVLEGQMADLVKRLRLPEDWRERLEELAEHREERDQVEGKRRYVQGKLRRLKDLYLEGDIDKTEYGRSKAELRAQLDALRMPQQPDIEEAGETLEELGETWAGAPRKIQREMLKVIFEAVYVDVLAERLVCVRPYPQFAPLFRMDGMEEREDGCFYYDEEDEEVGPED